jgi:DNA-binding NarL/FixJ family response regulator
MLKTCTTASGQCREKIGPLTLLNEFPQILNGHLYTESIIPTMVSRPARIVSPVMVGRDSELDALGQALRLAQQGAGRCIVVAGEAGIGKSRLVAELRTRAIAERWIILEGHCFEQDLSFPYAPWTDALRAFLATRTISEIRELLGSLASEFVKLLPELSLLLPGLQPNPPLDAGSEKRRLFETLARFVAQLAQSQPLLVVLEDLHWSDEQSLELMHLLARRASSLPMLFVGTYRSEDIPPRLAHHLAALDHNRLADEIRLAPLSRDGVEQMVRTTLDAAHAMIPAKLDVLVPLTEGNPFFVEELLKSLVEAGGFDQLQVPRTIQDSVGRRVEHLPEGVRRVLSFAAVMGDQFDFGLLQTVAGQDEQSLLLILKELIAAQLIVEQSADQFAFRHALTREAVYTSLMLRERKAIHQTIGEALERLAGARTDASAAQLAYHFYQGGVWQKAMPYSQRAGEQAQALYAPREALTHFTQALDAAQNAGIPAPRISLRGRAQAYEVLGEFDHARADHEAAIESARQEENRADEWQALIDLGFLWQSRDLERAGEYYQRAVELARELGNSSILAQSLNRVGNWHLNRGRALEALPLHQEALSLFQERNDRHGVARTMDLSAIVSFRLGDVIQGTTYLEQAIPILRDVDDRQALVNTLTNLASLAQFETEVLGELNYRHLADLSKEALQIARGFHWSQGEARALIPGAMNQSQAGDYARALEWLGRANAILEAIGHRESFARLHLTSGQILIELLALTEARQRLEAGLALAQELGAGFLTLSAIARLATASVLQNDLVRAQELLDTWLPTEYPKARLTIHERSLWGGRAQLELAQGNPGRALEIIEWLLASTVNLAQHGPHAVPYLSRLRARALAALGHMQDAEAELQGTLPVASRQGQRSMLWRLHADLGNVYRAMGRRDAAERKFSSARTIIRDLANNVPEGALRNNFLKQALATLPPAPNLTPRQVAKREFGGLTAREREIAALIAQGKSNREIADELVISEPTAERHVANILSKLGFNSRTQIAVWAVEKGLGK